MAGARSHRMHRRAIRLIDGLMRAPLIPAVAAQGHPVAHRPMVGIKHAQLDIGAVDGDRLAGIQTDRAQAVRVLPIMQDDIALGIHARQHEGMLAADLGTLRAR